MFSNTISSHILCMMRSQPTRSLPTLAARCVLLVDERWLSIEHINMALIYTDQHVRHIRYFLLVMCFFFKWFCELQFCQFCIVLLFILGSMSGMSWYVLTQLFGQHYITGLYVLFLFVVGFNSIYCFFFFVGLNSIPQSATNTDALCTSRVVWHNAMMRP